MTYVFYDKPKLVKCCDDAVKKWGDKNEIYYRWAGYRSSRMHKVSKYSNGRSYIRLDVLANLCHYLNKNPNDFILGHTSSSGHIRKKHLINLPKFRNDVIKFRDCNLLTNNGLAMRCDVSVITIYKYLNKDLGDTTYIKDCFIQNVCNLIGKPIDDYIILKGKNNEKNG